MNTRGLLDQLLKSGQDLLQNKAGASQNKSASGGLGGLLSGASGSGGLGGLLSGAGGGALAAGAMGLLLGNKKVRKVGGKVAIYGGLAALGVLAYKAYGNYNAQKAPPHKVNRRPSIVCHRRRPNSTARPFSRRWSPLPKPTAISMTANAN